MPIRAPTPHWGHQVGRTSLYVEVEDGTLYRLEIPSDASFNLATPIAKGVKGPVVWAQCLGLPYKVRGGSSLCVAHQTYLVTWHFQVSPQIYLYKLLRPIAHASIFHIVFQVDFYFPQGLTINAKAVQHVNNSYLKSLTIYWRLCVFLV